MNLNEYLDYVAEDGSLEPFPKGLTTEGGAIELALELSYLSGQFSREAQLQTFSDARRLHRDRLKALTFDAVEVVMRFMNLFECRWDDDQLWHTCSDAAARHTSAKFHIVQMSGSITALNGEGMALAKRMRWDRVERCQPGAFVGTVNALMKELAQLIGSISTHADPVTLEKIAHEGLQNPAFGNEIMSREQFNELNTGDLIAAADQPFITYLVAANYGSRVTAMRSVDSTNPREWLLVMKARYDALSSKSVAEVSSDA